MAEENQRPEALGEEAGLKYDSAERPQNLAASLESVADRAAVGKAPGRSPKARKTR